MYFTLCCWVRGLRTEEPFAMLSGIIKKPILIIQALRMFLLVRVMVVMLVSVPVARFGISASK